MLQYYWNLATRFSVISRKLIWEILPDYREAVGFSTTPADSSINNGSPLLYTEQKCIFTIILFI